MNKIYMTKRRHDGKIAVCSELTRARGKMKSLVVAVAAATATLAVPVAEAAEVATVDGKQVVSGAPLAPVKIETKGENVAIGNAMVSGKAEVAIGENAVADGQNALAVGSQNKAIGDQTVAIGSVVKALKKQATAIGNETDALGYSSIAIGSDDLGTKTADNNAKGASAQYATFVYDAALEEVVSNPFTKKDGTQVVSIDPNNEAVTPYAKKVIKIVEPGNARLSGKVPKLTDAHKAVLEVLGINIVTGVDKNTNVEYTQNKNQENDGRIILLDGSDSIDEFMIEGGKRLDPAGYIGRLLNKFTLEAKIADPTLTDAQAIKKAPEYMERYAREMGYAKANDTFDLATSTGRQALFNAINEEYYKAYQNTRTTAVGSIAIGGKAQAMAKGSVSLGVAAMSRGDESLAMGVGTITTGDRAVGVGTLAIASGDRSVAIGTYTNAPNTLKGEMRYDSPRALGDDAVAIGAGAYVGKDITGTKSVALGAGSIVTEGFGDIEENLATGEWQGILHNYQSYDPNKAQGVNEIDPATGLMSTDKQFTRGKTTTGGTTGTIDKAYVGRLIYRNFAGATATGAVSVGYAGAEKRIQNVAAGEISPTSTDAINGSQLYIATFEVGQQVESSYFHTNEGTGKQEVGDTVSNKGKLAELAGARSNFTTTAGIETRATGNASTSMGYRSISGISDAKYQEMVFLDAELAKLKIAKTRAEDDIKAAEKIDETYKSRMQKINAALENFEQNMTNLDRQIATTDPSSDTYASLVSQKAEVAKAKELLTAQKNKLQADKDKADAAKLTAETALRDTITPAITEKSTQLNTFLADNAKKEAVAMGAKVQASGEKSVAMGSETVAAGNNTIALGQGALAGIAKEKQAAIDTALAGLRDPAKEYNDALNKLTELETKQREAEALPSTDATRAQKVQDATDAVNAQKTVVAEKKAAHATALETVKAAVAAATLKHNAIAIGNAAVASGEKSISVGFGNTVLADNAGAFGDPSTITADGTGSYSFGNNNYINTADTFVLGNSVGVAMSGTTFGTVANSVYLGTNSTATAGNDTVTEANVGNTKNLDKEGNAGITSTAGATGTVENAKVAEITYGTFAGKTAVGAVTVGSAGEERRIQNVAAGEISSTSTDAINGSQLYYAYKQAATPFTVTANSNKDTDAKNLDKQYAAADGKQVQLGETLNIAGSATTKNLTRDGSNTATDSTYSAQNIQTVVDNDGVQIQFAEKPEFDEVKVTDGTNSTTIKPTEIKVGDTTATNDKPVTITSGTNGGTISNLDGNLDGAKHGTNAPTTNATKPTTLTESNAATVGDVLNAGWNLQEKGVAKDFVAAYDTVNFIDGNATTVTVTNTDGKTSTIKYDVKVDGTTIKIDNGVLKAEIPPVPTIETTTLTDAKTGEGNTATDGADGKIDAPATGDENKFVKAGDIATAINKSGFSVKSGGNKATGDDATSTLINPGEEVVFSAGDNLTVKRIDNNFTFATKANVDFDEVTISNGTVPAVKLVNEAPINATNNPDGKAPTSSLNITNVDGKPTQITGVGSVLNTTTVATNPDANTATNPVDSKLVHLGNATNPLTENQLNSAATVGDLQNMGWVVKATGNAYSDVVKNANEVNFVGTNLAKVTGETKNGIRTITVDVNAQRTVEAADTPVIYTDADGNKLVKGEDGKFYKPADIANATYDPNTQTYTNNGTPVTPVNNVIASMNDGDEIANSPKQLSNVKGNLAPTYNKGDSKIGAADDVANAGKPTTETVDAPTTSASLSPVDAKKVYNNAATVGDVLNAGWNLQGNGVAKDFVKPYDTVNFVNGTGTTVDVSTDADGKVSVVKVNTLLTPVNLNNEPLVKGNDNKWYKAGDVTNGVPNQNAQEQTPSSVKVVNPTDNTTSTPTKLGNVASSLNNQDVNIDPDGNKTGGTAPSKTQLVNLNGTQQAPVNSNAAATVGDLQNMGWVVKAQSNQYADVVKNANEVEFRGIGVDVNGETDSDGKRVITIKAPISVASELEAELINNTGATGTGEASGKIALKADNSASGYATAGNVKDMINTAGWQIQENGTRKDLVKAGDKVNFVNGAGTTVSVTTATNGESSDVKVNIAKITLTNEDGKVVEPVTNATNLVKAIEDAKKELAEAQTPEAKVAAEKKVADAEKAADDAGLNKVATAQNVAEAINKSGFKLKADAVDGGTNTTAEDTADSKLKSEGELINPADTVIMQAGKNMTVKHEKDGKITYATKDDVEFNSVKVGKDEGGKKPVNLTTTKATEASNNPAENKPTTALDIKSTDGKPTQITGVGSTLNTTTVNTNPDGKADTPVTKNKLVNLTETSVNPNSAATVGDLQNMGWVVKAKGNSYSDVVKNANEVEFVGSGLATVTGETDAKGVRTITVNVNAQQTVETADTPVVYTNKAGDKLTKIGDKFYKVGDVVDGKPKTGAQAVDAGDVIASMNDGDNTADSPKQLSNVKGNLAPTYNKGDSKIGAADDATNAGKPTNVAIDVADITKSQVAPTVADVKNMYNNSATVGDVLNAGWNLQGNSKAVDFVKPYDTVNFVDGAGTKVEVTASEDGKTSTVKVNVDKGEITLEKTGTGTDAKETGKVLGSELTKDKNPAQAEKALADAKAELAKLGENADPTVKKAAEAKVAEAQNVVDAFNKVATVENVVNAINESGWKVKATADGGSVSGTTEELVKAGELVDFKAGKNIAIKQAGQNLTFSTVEKPDFTTVTVGNPTYTTADGKKVTKAGDKFYDEQGQEVPENTVITSTTPAVTFKAENAKVANVNPAEKMPSTALNITSVDGKPTQITGVGSTLNTKAVKTNPDGKSDTPVVNSNLLDLTGTKDAPVNSNAAATVGDLQNMGWVVSANGNDYKDTVKNANEVKFIGTDGIKVVGETKNDVREITISLDKGEVVKSNEFVVTKADNTTVEAVKVGDKYYAKADIDPTTGEPKAGTTALTPKTVENKGTGFVSGNQVADAIQKSGFTVGKQTDTAGVTFDNKDEKVNPDDNLKFADGKGTVVSTGTVKKLDSDGTVSTTTVVKVDIAQGDMDADGGKLIDKILDDAEKAVEEKQAIVKELAANPDNINDLIKAANDLKAAQDALTKLEEALDPNTAAARDKVTAAENALKQLSKEANPDVNELISAAQNVEKARNEFTKAKDAAPNKVATVADVVDAVNRTGFNLKVSGNTLTGTAPVAGELINPADTVEMIAGKNMTVKHDTDGKITYATKDDVNFTSVQFGDNGPKINAVDEKDDKGNPVNAISVNNAKISNVADGEISPTSKDAVNGSQLYALTGGSITDVENVTIVNPITKEEKVIEKVIVDAEGKPALVTYNVDARGEYIQNSVISAINHMNTQGIKYFHTRDGSNRDTDDQQFNGEDSRASGNFSTAVGYKAHAKGDNAVAFGNETSAGEKSVAIGNVAVALGTQSVAIGDGVVASGTQSIAIGTGNVVSGSHSGAIGDPTYVNADNSYSVGNNNFIADGQTDVFALGNNIRNTSSNSVFLGTNSGYVAAGATTAGAGALESQVTGGVHNAYAGGKASEVKGVVSVGNVNSDGTMETRRIQNVAPGLISENSTDAINGSQLYSLTSQHKAQMGDIHNKINRNNKDLRAGIAGSNAAAGLPQVYIPGKSMIAASAGTFKGQSALAVGYSRASDNGKLILKLQGNANTRGEMGGSVGVGYQW